MATDVRRRCRSHPSYPGAVCSATIVPMAGRSDERVDVEGATLVWGDASRWKATLRDESERRHLELPLGERLRRALALVQRHERADERSRP